MSPTYKGTVTKVGTRVDSIGDDTRVYAIHSIQLARPEDVSEDDFRTDPAKHVKAFLTQEGHKVREVKGSPEQILKAISAPGTATPDAELVWYHIEVWVAYPQGVCLWETYG